MTERTHRRLGAGIAVGAVGLVLLLPLVGLLRSQGPPMEEGFMLVFPELVLDGEVANRDFLHLYGPGSLWTLAGWYRLFGVTLEVERLFGFLQQLGVAVALYLLARPWGRIVATGSAAIGAILMLAASGLTAFAWVGAVAALLVVLWCAIQSLRVGGRLARRWAMAAGLTGSVCLLFRPDLVLAVGLGLATLLPSFGRARLRALVAGFSVFVGGYVVHLALAGPGTAIRGLVIEPVFELRAGRRLPIPPPSDHFDGWNQGFADLAPPPWPDTLLSGPMQLRTWFFVFLASVPLLVAVGWWSVRRRPGDLRARTLLAVGLCAAGLVPQAVQRADSTHLAWAGCVPLAFIPVALSELLRPRLRRDIFRDVGVVVATFAMIFVLFGNFTLRTYFDYTLQSFGRHRSAVEIERGSRRFYYGRADTAADLQQLVADLPRCTRPGDRLLVGPTDLSRTASSDAFLYYLLPELPPATHYIEMDPGVANDLDSGLADDVASADVAVLTTAFLGFDEPNLSRERGSSAPQGVLESDFTLVRTYPTGIEVWLRDDHAASRPACDASAGVT